MSLILPYKYLEEFTKGRWNPTIKIIIIIFIILFFLGIIIEILDIFI